MKIGVLRETAAGERRIALVPESAKKLVEQGNEVLIEARGASADFADDAYVAAGARLANSADEVLGTADLILKIQPPNAAEIERMRSGAVLVAILQPFQNADTVRRLAAKSVTSFSLDLLPRITRAQAMDAALHKHLGGIARWQKPGGGYFFWLELPEGADAAALEARARAAATAATSRCCARTSALSSAASAGVPARAVAG